MVADPARCNDSRLGGVCCRAVNTGGTVMKLNRGDHLECDRDCMHSEEGLCKALECHIDMDVYQCPFYKTKAEDRAQKQLLNTVPKPDWDEYRKRTGTHPVSRDELADWLAQLEAIKPTKDEKTKKVVERFLEETKAMIPRKVVIEKIVDWLKSHPEGCGWCMTPEETAMRILEREVGDEEGTDETDETHVEISEDCVSERELAHKAYMESES